MLEYHKMILSKVCFDISLFEKELAKALKYLESEEITQLKDWCLNNFPQYPNVINKCFMASTQKVPFEQNHLFEEELNIFKSD